MWLVFIVLIIVLVYYVYYSPENFAKVKIGNNVYNVHDTFDNKDEAAMLLHKLNVKTKKLFEHIKQKGDGVYEDSKSLFKRYDPRKVYENSPYNIEGSTSYVLSKGRKFVLCLRNGDKLIDINTLFFVKLHELAHLMNTRVYGHPLIFWKRFKYLLFSAAEIGLYIPIDYKKYPLNYCGIKIDFNPMYDEKI